MRETLERVNGSSIARNTIHGWPVVVNKCFGSKANQVSLLLSSNFLCLTRISRLRENYSSDVPSGNCPDARCPHTLFRKLEAPRLRGNNAIRHNTPSKVVS